MFYSTDRLQISFIWPHLLGHVSCVGSDLIYKNTVALWVLQKLHNIMAKYTMNCICITGLYCELQLQCWYKSWTAKAMLVLYHELQ